MRIIAGSLHGSSLKAPRGEAIRPSSGRLREALFDVLAHAPWADPIAGSRILDAFAGTGALGLEALSRGAAQAIFLEKDPAVRVVLAANIAACGVRSAARVVAANATRPPRAPVSPANLVFLDPPYGEGLASLALAALAAAEWIAPGALIVAESSRKEPLAPLGTRLDERTIGAARLSFWRY